MGDLRLLGQPLEVPAHDTIELAPRRTQYCVVVPVLNEGSRIRDQVERMGATSALADIAVADGASTDGSVDPGFLRAQGVRALLVKRGPGRLSAQLRMAFYWALAEGYKGVITLDGNGKDGLDALPRFVESLEAGFDFVQGSRFMPTGHHANTPLGRLLAIRLFHAPLVSALAHYRYTDTTNGFRGHSARFLADSKVQVFRDVFDAYGLLPYLAVRAARLGYRVREVPVSRVYPGEGSTPTKLRGARAHLELVTDLYRLAVGDYNPRDCGSADR